MKLVLEGHPDRDDATRDDIVRAVKKMHMPNGPTYMIVSDGDGNYAQAAGADDRYVVESRSAYGEGFRHFRVCQPITGSDEEDVVYYRQKCSKHPPRQCPLTVRKSEVCDLGTVELAMSAYLLTGDRVATLQWRDVTEEYLKEAAGRRGTDEITAIRPSQR